MEEIDIIELLKRVKEGKAPKEIEINGGKFILKDLEKPLIECLYYKEDDDGYIINWLEENVVYIDTKIKILDKPIIKELPMTETVPNFDNTTTVTIQKAYSTDELADKINEIIKWINKENKDE